MFQIKRADTPQRPVYHAISQNSKKFIFIRIILDFRNQVNVKIDILVDIDTFFDIAEKQAQP